MVLKNEDLSIREGVQRVSQTVTTAPLHRWKHDSVTQTTPFLGGYTQRGRSEQETGNVGTCQRRSNQCHERNGSQPITKQNSRSPDHMAKLRRYKITLREIGKRRNSVKRRREHLLKQKGGGFWSGLNDCFRACCAQ